MDWLTSLIASRIGVALIVMFGSWAMAHVVDLFFKQVLRRLAQRTASTLDDRVLELLRRPIGGTLIILGTATAASLFPLEEAAARAFKGLLLTAVILIWAGAWQRVASEVLNRSSQVAGHGDLVQPRTLPIFDIGAKVVIWGGAFYFIFVAWQIDVSAWLASAGILGVILGFAAKDSFANLIAGVLILADRPYKIGDFLVLDTGERGRVVEIGIRSTRILTRSDVEIIIPNAQMAAARVTNESVGPRDASRVQLRVLVAYGTDLERVERLLSALPGEIPGVVITDPERKPRVRYRAFEDVGIALEVLAWITDPEQKGRVVHDLIKKVEPTLRAAGVEIPLPKRVLLTPQSLEPQPEAPPGPHRSVVGAPRPSEEQA